MIHVEAEDMDGYESCDTNCDGVSPNYIMFALPHSLSVD